jgi:hypothetical protein
LLHIGKHRVRPAGPPPSRISPADKVRWTALTFRQPCGLNARYPAGSTDEWEDGLRSVLGISETALGELPDRKPTGSIMIRLDQIANNVAAAYESLIAALREVLDDRFWE